MSEDALPRIADLVYQRIGFAPSGVLHARLGHLVDRRVVALGLPDAAGYAAILEHADDGEIESLAQALTINETHFFREPRQFEALRALLPALAPNEGPLRMLSAGCATGEEAYSLAMLAIRSPARKGREPEVWGADVDGRAVARAREGLYGAFSFRGGSLALAEEFLMPEVGRWRVTPAIRRLTRFEQLNLLDSSPPGRFHVIFCRNVLLYLTSEHRRALVERCHELLAPGGVLFVGSSEALVEPAHGFQRALERGVAFYRRQPDARDSAGVTCHTPSLEPTPDSDAGRAPRRILAIGCSTGGPTVVADFLERLPTGLGLAVLVAQHMPEAFTAGFARRLNRLSAYQVVEARDDMLLQRDHVYVAPGNGNLRVVAGGALRVGAREAGDVYAPTIDHTFQSLVDARLAHATLGLLLTGMGDDGAAGLAALAAAGASTAVQDPRDTVVAGMVNAALAAGAARHVVPTAELARHVTDWARGDEEHAGATTRGRMAGCES